MSDLGFTDKSVRQNGRRKIGQMISNPVVYNVKGP